MRNDNPLTGFLFAIVVGWPAIVLLLLAQANHNFNYNYNLQHMRFKPRASIQQHLSDKAAYLEHQLAVQKSYNKQMNQNNQDAVNIIQDFMDRANKSLEER